MNTLVIMNHAGTGVYYALIPTVMLGGLENAKGVNANADEWGVTEEARDNVVRIFHQTGVEEKFSVTEFKETDKNSYGKLKEFLNPKPPFSVDEVWEIAM